MAYFCSQLIHLRQTWAMQPTYTVTAPARGAESLPPASTWLLVVVVAAAG